MLLMIGVYAVALVVVIYFTRATARRVVGALVGGAVVGVMVLGAITLGEALGWWKIPFAYFTLIFYIGVAITCSPIYLVTWRVAEGVSVGAITQLRTVTCEVASCGTGTP